MDSNNRNFIYAYDDDDQKIIIIDSETGQRIETRNNRLLPVLQHLNDEKRDVILRKFTVWCTRRCNSAIKPIQKKFLDLAEQIIQNKADVPMLREMYEQSESEAVAVDTVGLRQGSQKAPGFLASRECVNPNAFKGAINAAQFHSLWAEMNGGTEQVAGLNQVRNRPGKDILEKTEQAQIDYLLDLMGEQTIK